MKFFSVCAACFLVYAEASVEIYEKLVSNQGSDELCLNLVESVMEPVFVNDVADYLETEYEGGRFLSDKLSNSVGRMTSNGRFRKFQLHAARLYIECEGRVEALKEAREREDAESISEQRFQAEKEVQKNDGGLQSGAQTVGLAKARARRHNELNKALVYLTRNSGNMLNDPLAIEECKKLTDADEFRTFTVNYLVGAYEDQTVIEAFKRVFGNTMDIDAFELHALRLLHLCASITSV
jgi:hypothetical protein